MILLYALMSSYWPLFTPTADTFCHIVPLLLLILETGASRVSMLVAMLIRCIACSVEFLLYHSTCYVF